MREAADALLAQQPHEELQANEGEDAETEDGQDHHICQLPHGLDQSANDGLQTLAEERRDTYNKYTIRQMNFSVQDLK